MESALPLLLHPVRWQIVQSLAQRPATPSQLHEAIPGTAAATLYRQLQALVEGGLVAVASETKVRGAVERTYALTGLLDATDDTPEQRRAQAVLLLTLLQADVDAALTSARSPEEMAGLTLTRSRLHATPDELAALQERLLELVTPLLTPHGGSSPLTLGLVMVPERAATQDAERDLAADAPPGP